MDRLYAVSFRGKMCYLIGYIPEEKYTLVEELANQLASDVPEYCKCLINALHSDFGIELKHHPVEYVFRIRNK